MHGGMLLGCSAARWSRHLKYDNRTSVWLGQYRGSNHYQGPLATRDPAPRSTQAHTAMARGRLPIEPNPKDTRLQR
jgi:hypothetical protein